ncbi:MAG: DNA-binding protein WhiA [Bacilli bacterium]|nr:DNA-binding protein WhiA [Bacilli bacterium]
MPNKTISFAQEVKEEIVSGFWNDARKRSLLSAFIKNNGHIRISGGKQSLELSSENAKIAKSLYTFITDLYGVPLRFAYTRGMRLNKRVKYHVLIDNPDDILSDLEVSFLEGKVPHNLVANDELASAYLAGSFLSSGSVNDPKTSNYHLEIAFSDANYAKWFLHVLNKINNHQFVGKIAKRRLQTIVYIKRSDSISEFLIQIGATSCALRFEDVRVDRDFSNIGNRQQNLDNANFGKTLSTGKRQKEEIEYLVEHKGWSFFDGNIKLRLAAEYRLKKEDASLLEIADMLSEELASTITKSNVNHLYRRIHELYLEATK